MRGSPPLVLPLSLSPRPYLLLLLPLLLLSSHHARASLLPPRVRISPAAVTAGAPTLLTYVADVNATSATSFRELPAEWTLAGDGDGDCTLDADAAAGTAEVLCTTAGARTLLLERGGVSSEVAMVFGPPEGCFAWETALHAASDSEAASPLLTLPPASAAHELHVWAGADSDEEARTRTAQLFHLGERPAASPAPGTGALAGEAVWDAGLSRWRVPLQSAGAEAAVLRIDGRSVSVMGCGAAPRSVVVPVRKFGGVEGVWAAADLAAEDDSDADEFRAVRDPCALNVAVLIKGRRAFLAQAGLLPHPAAAAAVPGEVAGAAVAGDSLLVLRPGGAVERLAGADADALEAVSVPVEGATALAGAGACDTLRTALNETSPANRWAAAWNDTAAAVTEDGGATWSPLDLPDDLDGPVASVVRLFGTAATLVLAGAAVEVLDGAAGGGWVRGHVFDASAGVARLAQHPGGSGELLAYGGEGGVFYGPDAGVCFFALDMRPAMEAGEAAARLAFDWSGGSFVALTTLGRAYAGAAGLPEAVALNGGETPSGAAAATDVAYLRAGEPAALRVSGSHAYAAASDVAASAEVAACPYESQEASDADADIYLDMSERRTVQLSLRAGLGSTNAHSVSASDPVRVGFTVEASSSSSAASGASVQARAVTVFESPGALADATRAERMEEARGDASLRVAPVRDSLRCEGGGEARVARVRVGCPPNRHLRVRGAAGDGCGQVRLTGGGPAADTLALLGLREDEYSAAVYGCRFSVYHQSTAGFRPEVEVWDGDQLVGELPADYVLRETRGRGGFTYNATNGGMGCDRRPMTWAEAARAAESAGVPLDEAWTPLTHRSCHGGGGGGGGGDDDDEEDGYSAGSTYQILNGTNLNYIKFSPTGRDGLFLFKARVVDPAYSYCELEAYFALDVFGAPMPLAEAMTIVGSATAAVLLVLVATYAYYRHQMRLKVD